MRGNVPVTGREASALLGFLNEIQNLLLLFRQFSHANQAAAGGLIGRVLRICHLNFVLVSGFRVSDFGFVFAGQRCPAEKIWDMLRLRGEGDPIVRSIMYPTYTIQMN